MAITLRRGGTQSGSISGKAGMSSQAGKVGISGKAGMSGQAGKSGMTGKLARCRQKANINLLIDLVLIQRSFFGRAELVLEYLTLIVAPMS